MVKNYRETANGVRAGGCS